MSTYRSRLAHWATFGLETIIHQQRQKVARYFTIAALFILSSVVTMKVVQWLLY